MYIPYFVSATTVIIPIFTVNGFLREQKLHDTTNGTAQDVISPRYEAIRRKTTASGGAFSGGTFHTTRYVNSLAGQPLRHSGDEGTYIIPRPTVSEPPKYPLPYYSVITVMVTFVPCSNKRPKAD